MGACTSQQIKDVDQETPSPEIPHKHAFASFHKKTKSTNDHQGEKNVQRSGKKRKGKKIKDPVQNKENAVYERNDHVKSHINNNMGVFNSKKEKPEITELLESPSVKRASRLCREDSQKRSKDSTNKRVLVSSVNREKSDIIPSQNTFLKNPVETVHEDKNKTNQLLKESIQAKTNVIKKERNEPNVNQLDGVKNDKAVIPADESIPTLSSHEGERTVEDVVENVVETEETLECVTETAQNKIDDSKNDEPNLEPQEGIRNNDSIVDKPILFTTQEDSSTSDTVCQESKETIEEVVEEIVYITVEEKIFQQRTPGGPSVSEILEDNSCKTEKISNELENQDISQSQEIRISDENFRAIISDENNHSDLIIDSNQEQIPCSEINLKPQQNDLSIVSNENVDNDNYDSVEQEIDEFARDFTSSILNKVISEFTVTGEDESVDEIKTKPSPSKYKQFILQKYAEKMIDKLMVDLCIQPLTKKPKQQNISMKYANDLSQSIILKILKESFELDNYHSDEKETLLNTVANDITASVLSNSISELENSLSEKNETLLNTIANDITASVLSNSISELENSILEKDETLLNTVANDITASVLSNSISELENSLSEKNETLLKTVANDITASVLSQSITELENENLKSHGKPKELSETQNNNVKNEHFQSDFNDGSTSNASELILTIDNDVDVPTANNTSKTDQNQNNIITNQKKAAVSDRPLSGYAEKLAMLLAEEEDLEFDSDEELSESLEKIKQSFPSERSISAEISNIQDQYTKKEIDDYKSKDFQTKVHRRKQERRGKRFRGERPRSLYAQDMLADILNEDQEEFDDNDDYETNENCTNKSIVNGHGNSEAVINGHTISTDDDDDDDEEEDDEEEDSAFDDSEEESEEDVLEDEIQPVSEMVVLLENRIPLQKKISVSYDSEEMYTDQYTDEVMKANVITNNSNDHHIPVLRKAAVIDAGCGILKAGLGGNTRPSCYCPSVIGVPRRFSQDISKMKKGYYVGDDAWTAAGMLQIEHPIKHDITNWADVTNILEHLLADQLNVNDGEHPILMTEMSACKKKQREKITEIMFERFGIPSFYLANQSCLAMYSKGIVSGISLNSGFYHTHATPIYEGHVIQHGITQLDIGGDHVTNSLGRRIMGTQGLQFNTSSEKLVLNAMKQSLCYVALDPMKETEKYQNTSSMFEKFDLPDGQEIEIGTERFIAPEILFDPNLVGLQQPSVAELVHQTLANVDVELQSLYTQNVLVSGGNTKIKGFGARLEKELQYHENVAITPKYADDAILSTWVGASVLASIEGYRNQWISMSEYVERGSSTVHMRCF